MQSQSTTYQAEFAPPPEPARGRSYGLAAAAHILLFVALGLATRWSTQPTVVTAEAELWSAIPQQAAPQLVEPEPAPVEPTPPQPQPEPPKSAPRPAPAPEPEVQKQDADIALKKKKEEEKKKALEKELAEKLRKEKLAKEKQAKDKAEKEKAEKEKAEKEKKLKEQKAKDELARKKADERKKQEAQDKADAARADAIRKENLKRMAGLAGATGGPGATGTALKSSGPSATYAGRLVARIKPNITFPGDVPGNPRAEVEVRASNNGTILSRHLLQSSGNAAWDDAVLKAIDKTRVLPVDTDGRVPSVIVLGFRPLD